MKETDYRFKIYQMSRIIAEVEWYLDILIAILLWQLGLTQAFCAFLAFAIVTTLLQMITIYYQRKWFENKFKMDVC